MNTKAVRTEEDIEQTFDTYADMIYSLSYIMLKNKSKHFIARGTVSSR